MNLKELATAAPAHISALRATALEQAGDYELPISGDSTTLAAAYSKGWRVSTCL